MFFEEHYFETWEPTPENFTLAPSESYGPKSFTLKSTLGDDVLGGFSYDAYVPSSNTTATVLWSYDILKEDDKISMPNIFFTFASILILAVTIAIIHIRKGRKLN